MAPHVVTLPREGDYYRISDAQLLENVERIVRQVRHECALGFGQVEEDEQRIVQLQKFIREVSKTRAGNEYDASGSRYRKNPRRYDSSQLFAKVNHAYQEAYKEHSLASARINQQNVMGPYSQELESLIQVLIHEIHLHVRLTEIHEDCPVFNTGLSVLTTDDMNEMEKGVIGPIPAYGYKAEANKWWDKLRQATPLSNLQRRRLVFGDPIFAVSYKHKGVGGIEQRMEYGEWVELNKQASSRTSKAHMYEYFLWLDIVYSRNRDKTDSWARGGIAPYMSCTVLTTPRDISDSFWCRLERFISALSLGPPGTPCEGVQSPVHDIYTVIKYAAQGILLTNMMTQNRIWESDAQGLIRWAMNSSYKRPEITIGSTEKDAQVGVGLMHMMSWWSPENALPGFLRTFREHKLETESIKRRASDWHGITEWVSQHVNFVGGDENAQGSLLFTEIYRRVKCQYLGLQEGAHYAQLTYRHFDGTESRMLVSLAGCDVYEAHILEIRLAVRAVRQHHVDPTSIDMSQVTWRAPLSQPSPYRCDRCEISACLRDELILSLEGEHNEISIRPREVSRVLADRPRNGEKEHLTHDTIERLRHASGWNCDDVKLALVENTIGFERYAEAERPT